MPDQRGRDEQYHSLRLLAMIIYSRPHPNTYSHEGPDITLSPFNPKPKYACLVLASETPKPLNP